MDSVLNDRCVVLTNTTDVYVDSFTIYSALNSPDNLSEICVILHGIFWFSLFGLDEIQPCLLEQFRQ